MSNTRMSMIAPTVHCGRIRATGPELALRTGLTNNRPSRERRLSAVADDTVRAPVPTSVYRYYDRHDFLIYVGITARGMERNSEHNQHAEWWRFTVRQDVDHLSTRAEALARERDLILRYRPPFNRQHNPDWRAMRAAYYAWTQSEPDPAAVDPRAVVDELGRRLPLVTLEQQRSRLTLRTRLEHYAVASRLRASPQLTFVVNHRASIRSIEMRGPFAVVDIRGVDLPSTPGAVGRVRFVSQKPVEFRISSVNLADF